MTQENEMLLWILVGMSLLGSGHAQVTCSPGQYSPYANATACNNCTPGFYNPNYGDFTCYPCTTGTFSSSYAASSCTACASGSYAGETMFISHNTLRYTQLFNIDTGTLYAQIGNGTSGGNNDGSGTNALFNQPGSIIPITSDGSKYFVGDNSAKIVRKLDIFSQNVTTVIGLYNTAANTNGIGTNARVGGIYTILLSWDKTFSLMMDATRRQILQVNMSSLYTRNIVGPYALSGIVDGIGTNARLTLFYSMCADSAFANIFMFDSGYFRYLNMSNYNLSTIAGTGNQTFEPLGVNFGIVYGMFMMPDQQRIVYSDTNVLRTINITNAAVVTVAGTGVSATTDGIGTNAQLKLPRFMCISTGDPFTLFVTQSSALVRKVNIITWAVTTLPTTATSSTMYITMLPFSFATACISCSTGKYGLSAGATASGTCQLCQAGSYNTGVGIGNCSVCAAGTYGTGTGAINSNVCIGCSNGTFSTASGASSSGLCVGCQNGTYNTGVGQVNCSLCAAGTYGTATGYNAQAQCANCPSGTYSTNLGTTSAGLCSSCPAGTFGNASGLSACLTCVAGAYSTTTGATVCQLCYAGSYGAAAGCSISNLTWLFLNTTTGYYYLSLPSPMGCQRVYSGSSTTQYYTKGRIYSTLSANLTTVQMYVAYIGNPTNPCGSSTYDTTYATYPSSSAYGIDFGSATCCSNLQATTVFSLVGTPFSVPSGVSAWTYGQTGVCSASQSSPGMSCSSVQTCTITVKGNCAGMWWNGLMTVYNTSIFQSDIASMCTTSVPTAGLSCSGSGACCVACQAGSYSANQGASVCSQCAIGSYQSSIGSSTCVACAAGSYQNTTGNSQCILCSSGTYFPNASGTTCITCVAGTFASSPGASTCTGCYAGRYGTIAGWDGSVPGNLTWLFYNTTTGNYYVNFPSPVACQRYFSGSNTIQYYSKARLYSTLQVSMTSVQFYVQYLGNPTNPCGASPVDTTYATYSLSTVYGIEFGTAASCNQLLATTYFTLVGTPFSLPNGVSGWTYGGTGVCSASYSSPGLSCSSVQTCTITVQGNCALLYWNGLTNVYDTASFKSDIFAACMAYGGSSQLNCSGTESSRCYACAAGSYSSSQGSTVCVQCTPGFYQSAVASSTCFICAAGSYQSATGGSQCILCSSGTYFPNASGTTCITCVAGTFASSPGASTCTGCYAGRYGTIAGWDGSVPGNLTWLFYNTTTGNYYVNFPSPVACQRYFSGSNTIQYYSKARLYSTLQVSMTSVQFYVQYLGNPTNPCGASPVDTTYATYSLSTVYGIEFGTAASCNQLLATTYFTLVGTPFSLPNGVSGWTYGGTGVCSASYSSPGLSCSSVQTCTITVQGNCALLYWNGLTNVYDTASFKSDIFAACMAYGGSSQLNCSGTESSRCYACAAGSYSSSQGSTVCVQCTPGFYQSAVASSTCFICAAGSYQSATGGSQCTICSAGLYMSSSNGTTCNSCQQGTFVSTLGATTCVGCGAGTYNTNAACNGIGSMNSTTWLFFNASSNYSYLSMPSPMPCQRNYDGNPTTQYWSKVRINSLLQYTSSTVQLYVQYLGNPSNPCLSSTSDSKYATYQIGQSALFIDFGGARSCFGYTATTQFSLVNTPFSISNGLSSWTVGSSSCSAGGTTTPGATCSSVQSCTITVFGNCGSISFKGLLNVYDAVSYKSDIITTCNLYGSSTSLDCTGVPNVCCNQCPSGSYTTGVASSACTSCQQGMYSSGSGASVCTSCSTGSYASASGASTCTACVAGTYANGTSNPCVSCSAGTYQTGVSSANCTLCGASTYQTGTGMISPLSCVTCSGGSYSTAMGASTCLSCPQNSWCASGVQNTCPLNSNSVANASQQNQCLCNAGYWGNGALVGTSPCALCLAGRYCPGGNNNLTIACPGNATSPAGAYAITQCMCLPGFYGVNGTNCTLCPQGSYCASGVLNPCPGNSSSPTQSGNISSCACNAGFFGSASCSECPMAYYCPGGLTSIQCTPNATTASTRSISYMQCFCDRGYAGINNTACYPCPVGSWCWTGVVNNCPPNSVSPLYSNYMNNCTCNVGYYGPGGGPCVLCNQGTYNTLQGASSCLACESGLYSTLYGGLNCTACDAGTYQTGTGLTAASDCSLCPGGTYQTGSAAVAQAACIACSGGTYATAQGMQDSSGCMVCSVNSYCNRGQQNACPANTNGDLGLTYQSQCQCVAGYACVGLKDVWVNVTTQQTPDLDSVASVLSALSGVLGVAGVAQLT